MLHTLFGSNRPFALAFLFLPALVFGVLAGLFTEVPEFVLGGPMFDWLNSSIGSYKWLSIFLGVLINMGSAMLLNTISNEHSLNRKENFFPALVFILFTATNLTWWYFNPVSVAVLFFLLALRRLLPIYRVQAVTSNVFDAGFLLAVAASFFPPMVLTFPLVWISLIQLRSFDFREWLVPLSGILVPGLYLAAYYYYQGYELDYSEYLIYTNSSISLEGNPNNWYLAFLVISIVMSIVGFAFFVSDMQVSTVHKKNTKRVFIWSAITLVATLVYTLYLPGADYSLFWLIGIPVAISLGDFFNYQKRQMVISLLFYAWLILALCHPLFS